jgi:hypothetical protein
MELCKTPWKEREGKKKGVRKERRDWMEEAEDPKKGVSVPFVHHPTTHPTPLQVECRTPKCLPPCL